MSYIMQAGDFLIYRLKRILNPKHCGRQAGNAPLSQSKQAKHPYSAASLNYNSLLSFADTFVWI